MSPIALLPAHIDRLLDRPWNPSASAQVDRWLWYAELEKLPTSRRQMSDRGVQQ